MGRHRILTTEQERQVIAVLDAGLEQQKVAELFRVSRSTVQRVVGRARRAELAPLDELLAEFDQPFDDLLAELGEPAAAGGRRVPWQQAAAALVQSAPERWAR